MRNQVDSGTAIGLRELPRAQLEGFHRAALDILDTVGALVHEENALTLLADAGCRIDGRMAYLPPSLVEDAIAGSPSSIQIFNRLGNPAMDLGGVRSYFGTGSDLLHIIDIETGERRKAVLSDVQRAAALVDGLPNLDFAMSYASPSDIPQDLTHQYSFRAMVENTSKPIVFTSWNRSVTQDIIEMAECIAGGEKALSEKPFIISYLEPNSPLQHSREAMQKLMYTAQKGLPLLYVPGIVGGGSAPVTPAGIIVQGLAESLFGLVVAQLVRKGAPVIFGAGAGIMDMKTTTAPYFTPEGIACEIAWCEMAHHFYNLPVWGTSGCSDSKLPDLQAATEATTTLLFSTLAGANLIHDVGYIDTGLCGSYEMIVLMDELIEFVRRVVSCLPPAVDPSDINAIREVGPGGSFLATGHTLANFKRNWRPRYFNHDFYDKWKQGGGIGLREHLREVVKGVLTGHAVIPIPDDTERELELIIQKASRAV